jgi:DNA recombination protein RmuC
MNFLSVAAVTVAVFACAACFMLFTALGRSRRQANAMELELATLRAQAAGLQRDADEMRELRHQNALYLEQKSIAVTERLESEKKLQALQAEREHTRSEKEQAVAARMEAQKQLELGQQKMEEMHKRMGDWELQRAESLKAATASIFEVGGKLSSKLLEDHKREADAAKKEAEAAVKKTSDGLMEQFMTVTKSVASLQTQTHENKDKMATVWRALTSPSGAGHMAEVGLENSLKNLGLERGRDYVMQYAVNGEESGKLRPDAVIFLPQDMVMVIDSKASKFLMEIAEAKDEVGEAEALVRLSKTMNTHLSDLINKNYTAAIVAAYKEAGRGDKIRTTLNVMYLPSESAVLHLKRADPEFVQKAEKNGIILAGPASLSGLLSLARLNIGMEKQAANQEAIVAGIQDLMDSMAVMLSHAEKVGRGLKSAADNFGQFASSVNMRVLPKVRKLIGLGVKPNKNKELPARIASYEIRLSDDILTIEGESEVVEELSLIESFPKKVSA